MFDNNSWYYNHFDHWYKRQQYNYSDYRYETYRSSFPLGIQLHYLFRKGINSVAGEQIEGLEWYYGFGAQFNFRRFNYSYWYKRNGDPNWYYDENRTAVDLELGPDAVIGLEYKIPESKFSLFIDLDLFLEIIQDPFIFHPQAGIGARYHF
mgnify:CR=1 FL=1